MYSTVDLSTCDFIVGYYEHAQRYIGITLRLLRRGFLDFESTVVKIRETLYFLHDQIYQLLQAVYRRLDRFNNQIHATLHVS